MKFGLSASPRCFSTPRMVSWHAWQHLWLFNCLACKDHAKIMQGWSVILSEVFPSCHVTRWKELEKSSGVSKATWRAKGRWLMGCISCVIGILCAAMEDPLSSQADVQNAHHVSSFSVRSGVVGACFLICLSLNRRAHVAWRKVICQKPAQGPQNWSHNWLP